LFTTSVCTKNKDESGSWNHCVIYLATVSGRLNVLPGDWFEPHVLSGALQGQVEGGAGAVDSAQRRNPLRALGECGEFHKTSVHLLPDADRERVVVLEGDEGFDGDNLA